ncbi:hypothetical protein A3758_13760 [Oleiphilus sp. HI0118]|uniref:hypothetical protein n=1 Tax=Oleiphilus sp. HI0079 TaxID=1822254 RepID=UPI0007C37128|nr:hypothetical protein [Oleiphilus sp. HI0079]KZZ09554.1 hypothetical protein A3750_09030 [Oleiphilus sp. HI0079]KZZ11188.1 hypothetical protein A3750_19895 [Oleiphilus sp. HI0079]KZZ46871.1 hypothetical protein A3758_35830 [Oleiphilus sp. HI0118]KZZ49911.1 hypothetical protein A3758_13760 [Oleiphilus sp. HI0118]
MSKLKNRFSDEVKGKYSSIVMILPWDQIKDLRYNRSLSSRLLGNYSLDDLKRLPIKNVSTSRSELYVFVPAKLENVGKDLIQGYGYIYSDNQEVKVGSTKMRSYLSLHRSEKTMLILRGGISLVSRNGSLFNDLADRKLKSDHELTDLFKQLDSDLLLVGKSASGVSSFLL